MGWLRLQVLAAWDTFTPRLPFTAWLHLRFALSRRRFSSRLQSAGSLRLQSIAAWNSFPFTPIICGLAQSTSFSGAVQFISAPVTCRLAPFALYFATVQVFLTPIICGLAPSMKLSRLEQFLFACINSALAPSTSPAGMKHFYSSPVVCGLAPFAHYFVTVQVFFTPIICGLAPSINHCGVVQVFVPPINFELAPATSSSGVEHFYSVPISCGLASFPGIFLLFTHRDYFYNLGVIVYSNVSHSLHWRYIAFRVQLIHLSAIDNVVFWSLLIRWFFIETLASIFIKALIQNFHGSLLQPFCYFSIYSLFTPFPPYLYYFSQRQLRRRLQTAMDTVHNFIPILLYRHLVTDVARRREKGLSPHEIYFVILLYRQLEALSCHPESHKALTGMKPSHSAPQRFIQVVRTARTLSSKQTCRAVTIEEAAE